MFKPKTNYAKIAYDAILFFVSTGQVRKTNEDKISADLKLNRACIVTIYDQNNILMGQYGDIIPQNKFLYDEIIENAIDGLYKEDRISLKATRKKAKKLNKKARLLTTNIFRIVQILEEKEIKKGKKFGRIINTIQEISLSSRSIAQNCYDHIENNHAKPYEDEFESIQQLIDFLKKEIALSF